MYGAYAAWVATVLCIVLCISERTASIAQDGLAHESLSAEELLYLTIGYDWLLFRSGRSVCINQSIGYYSADGLAHSIPTSYSIAFLFRRLLIVDSVNVA